MREVSAWIFANMKSAPIVDHREKWHIECKIQYIVKWSNMYTKGFMARSAYET